MQVSSEKVELTGSSEEADEPQLWVRQAKVDEFVGPTYEDGPVRFTLHSSL